MRRTEIVDSANQIHTMIRRTNRTSSRPIGMLKTVVEVFDDGVTELYPDMHGCILRSSCSGSALCEIHPVTHESQFCFPTHFLKIYSTSSRKIRAGRRAAYVHSMSQGEKGPLTLRETPVGVRTQHQKLSVLRTSLSG